MIIDIHNHISRKNNPYYLPADAYIPVMDELGIEKAVILGKDYGDLGDRLDANLTDEDVASFCAEFPGRFIGFTAVHPDRPVDRNLERLEKAVETFGMHGIKLNPAAGFYPNDTALYPVYERAASLRLPVVIHSGLKPPSEGCRIKFCNPLDIDDVAVDFPDLSLVIAHSGYPWVQEAIQVGLYAENVCIDISTLNQIEEVMGCEVVMPTLKMLHNALGAGRILFGTDGIFNSETLKQAVMSADFLTDNERDMIFYKNAEKILTR